jgi:uncharacterized phiE125 gp8 family phage protein
MTLRTLILPTIEPVSLTDAKEHLRVDFTEDDSYILALISAARGYVEGFQKRSLAAQTLELTLDYFPSTIPLKRGPIQAVTSVKYTKADGSSVTIDPSEYLLTSTGDIYPVRCWPNAALVRVEGVQVQYTAGYTTIPPATKQAMLLLIGHWYENREAVVIGKAPAKMPMAVESLLWLDRMW